jgi:hypothetical protein
MSRLRLAPTDGGWRAVLGEYRAPALFAVFAVVIALSVGYAVGTIGSPSASPTVVAPPNPTLNLGATAAAVPTNQVTGSGTAAVRIRGDTVEVTLTTSGLLAGAPHLMHIHGEGLGSCPTASAARLHNGHLSISTGDGIRFYGPTLVSLTEWGSTAGTVPNNVDFNRYPASGAIHYTRTMIVSQLTADLIRDGNAVIVVHGIDYNHNNVYDFAALGVSDLDKTFPGEATAPALCGPLRREIGVASTAHGPERGTPVTTYEASLVPQANPGGWTADQAALFCTPGSVDVGLSGAGAASAPAVASG